jgi:two-component system, OmpR family, phosphate regulon sensor histidine kinase PhoR
LVNLPSQPRSNITKQLRLLDNPTRLLITLSLVFTTLALILIAEYLEFDNAWLIRYIALVPILYVSYNYRIRAGIVTASFFSLAYLPAFLYSARIDWKAFETIQILGFMILTHAAAYITANIVASSKSEEALSKTVMEWGELLARIKDLDEMIEFLLQQAKIICDVDDVLLLLRNPLNLQWEVMSEDKKTVLPDKKDSSIPLYDWLLSQDNAFFLNHLDRKPSFISLRIEASEYQLHSIMGLPLRLQDGTLSGQLVMINRRDGDFSTLDFQQVRDLIIGSERLIEQAGMYARTDYSLSKRVRQLAAIQRTAREFNSILVPEVIIDRTIECAMEITDADAGLVFLHTENIGPIIQSRGVHEKQLLKEFDIPKINELDVNVNSLEVKIPQLLTATSSRLLVSIRRENQFFGFILVESSSPQIFRDASKHVLSILADHAAIALDNVRLFNDIQTEQQRMSMIINSLAEGVFTTNRHGEIITINPSSLEIIHQSSGNTVGKTFCEVLKFHGEEHSDGICSLLSKLGNKERTEGYKFSFRASPGGQPFILELSMTPIPPSQGHPEGAVFVLRDVTQQEELERLQKELIAAISHELRSPLTNINNITETILSSQDQAAVQPIKGYLDKLTTQTNRLANFSDRILDVYKMETGQLKLQIRPVPIHLLIKKIYQQWRTIVEGRLLLRTYDQDLPWVWADEEALETVINNLVENAIKYSIPDSQIEIIIEPPSEGFILCGVKDQGPGIDSRQINKLFNRFYRIDGRDSQKVYGHGLGLYISRNLIEAMGGKIWVTSSIGNGSYFAFRVPIMEEQREREDFGY